ncbi:MAG TPA: type II toxin-antitoxin system RelE/ParE family toxin [Bryobacteraceae bacterium]|nr:type II toxin-antitoxin system RelE/ParE family toxin [Bryobacteraceae bacterium]
MQVFKTKWLARFAKHEGIADASLHEAIARAERGLVDADLGGGLIKQRVARRGKGRSGGYRMLIAYRLKKRAIFLYGFAKNERANIGADELLTAREIASPWLAADARQIARALAEGELQEVPYDEEEI